MDNATGLVTAISDRMCRPIVERAARRFCGPLCTPRHFFEMLLYVEDKRFLIHPGFDPLAIVRSLIFDLRGRALQGGSTICQQLYNVERERDLLKPTSRTISYKIAQAIWATHQELRTSKIKILDRYISSVYWGRSYYGLDSAAQGYFCASRSTLTPAQSFFLAERIANPNRFLPRRISNLLGRDVIAATLLENGTSVTEVAEIYAQIFGTRGQNAKPR
jgi:membrane peptidoglycan carboxypeptidase